MVLLKYEINLNINQVKYGFIKEENFTTALSKIG